MVRRMAVLFVACSVIGISVPAVVVGAGTSTRVSNVSGGGVSFFAWPGVSRGESTGRSPGPLATTAGGCTDSNALCLQNGWVGVNWSGGTGCTWATTENWGDGTSDKFTYQSTATTSHTYRAPGLYTFQASWTGTPSGCESGSGSALFEVPQDATLTPAAQEIRSPDILPTSCDCGSWPINSDTGSFWHTFTDLSVPGNGMSLDLTRTYSSLNADALGPLGYGWTDSYNMALSFDSSGSATVHEENGSLVTAQLSGTSYVFPSFVLATLVKNIDGTYTFTRRDKSEYAFSPTGELTKEIDRNGYITQLAYNTAGQLISVTDPAGRSITFSYGPNGLIASVTDPTGQKVAFTYNSALDLIAATNVGGKSWIFTYNPSHLLLTMTDPRGGVTSNTFDSLERVISQSDPLGNVTSYAYSGAAGSGTSTTAVTDPRGEKTDFQYSNNELISTTHGVGTPQQATWTYTYDPKTLGETSVIDPNGHTTTSTYDSSGNVLSMTDPLGRTTTATYNADNEPLTVTDPIGVTTSYAYDPSGNLLSKTTGTRTTSFTYGDALHPGEVTAYKDPEDQTTRLAYDAHGDLISVTDPLGHQSKATYDSLGRRLTATSPKGAVTTKTYDAFGDVLTVTDPLGHKTTNTYDADQNLLSTKDPVGNTTSYVYDLDNELTKATRPGNRSTTNTYDADGNVTSTTDAGGHVTTNTYDPLNRLASTRDPLGHVTRYTYDLAGNRTVLTNASGQTTTSTYDADNELTGLSYSDGMTPSVSYSYDADGRRTSMTDGTGTTSYTYDEFGQLTTTTDGAGVSTKYKYDPNGQLTSLTYPNGKAVTQGFDAAGDLTSVTDWLGHTTKFTYDADGNPTTQKVPSTTPVTDTTAYNAADQIASMTDKAGTTTLQGFTYTRNANSLVASVTPSGQATQAYSYDALNEVTKDGTGSYSYTAAGSLTALLGTKPLTYNAADQLTSSKVGTLTTSYGYDHQGDQVSATPSTGTSSGYTYDQAGDMTGFSHGTTTASYAYNGDGLRMSKPVKGVKTNFGWDLQSSTPLLLSDKSTSYIYGPGGLPIESISTAGTVTYYHHDQLGSTTLLTSATGAKVSTYTYDSYGLIAKMTGTSTNPLLFASQYRDAESGLYYLQARYYDPSTGQFMSVDPALSVTGQPYSYADGDPVNLADPTGRMGLGIVDRAVGWAVTSATGYGIDKAGHWGLPMVNQYLAAQGPPAEAFAGFSQTALALDSVSTGLAEIWGGEVIAPLVAWNADLLSQLVTQSGGPSWLANALNEVPDIAGQAQDWLLMNGVTDLTDGLNQAGVAGSYFADATWQEYQSSNRRGQCLRPLLEVCVRRREQGRPQVLSSAGGARSGPWWPRIPLRRPPRYT